MFPGSLMPYTSGKTSRIYSIKIFVLTTFIVSILGYIDFITGEISIDVLYIITICTVTWFTDVSIGVLCVIEIIVAKVTADYFDKIKIGSHIYEWNTINYLIMYLIVCLLVCKLKRALTR
jgi:hypothetical protein